MKRTNIKIDSLAYRGSGVGRVDNIVYFVPFAAPQDFLEIEIVKEEKRFRIGRIVKILEPSSYRTDPVCSYFGECGGCHWQHLDYQCQLKEKRNILKETILRIGKATPAIEEVIPSPEIYGYRNRTVLKYTADGRIGYFAAESHRLITIDNCPILLPQINSFLPRIKTVLSPQSPLPGAPAPGARLLDARLPGAPASGAPSPCIPSSGEIDLYLDAEGSLKHALISSSRKPAFPFSQVNHGVNSLLKETLHALVFDYSPKDKPPGILDLYCGDGNLSLHLADIAAAVCGWDFSAASIRKAGQKVRKLGLRNVKYKRSNVSRALAEIEKMDRSGEILIVDPPRTGLKGLIPVIVRLEFPFIFYISCVPPILARDLRDLIEAGYMIKKVVAFDMFPQTFHMETLVVLAR